MTAVRYCRSGSGRVAFSATGSGPVLLLEPGWVTHLRAQLEVGAFRAFVAGLAEHFTVVRFDKPGCGLSDRDTAGGGFEAQVGAAVAVLDALPARRFSVLGASQGGQVAVALAARCPDRVDRLALFGTCADGARLAPASVREALLGLVSAHWGLGSKVLADLFMPGADAGEVAAFGRLQRACATAEVATDLLRLYYETDVRELLPQVQARTAVLHREGDRATAFDLGRDVAAGIPDAVLVPLHGTEHLFYTGDSGAVLEAALSFLREPAAVPMPLTGREVTVARLVADGLTNRAIASRLGIADRTVDAHVEHIRRKLGVRSRAQVAAWITEHRPAAEG